VNIDLDGAKVAATAKVWTLSGKTTQATNSIENPTALVPVESTTAAGAKMRVAMPGYAIEVMEIDEE
jgi:alpha-L-arabinofuranosidase